jgi:hypothetical protein
MLEKRFLADFRPAMRPFACFVTSAFLLSTSPLHAESIDDDETSSSDSDGERSGTAPLGTAVFRTVSHFSLTAGSSAMVATTTPATTTPATSAAAPAVPPPPNDDGAGLRTAGYIAGGVGIAGFILFVVAGIGAKNAHDRLEENCGTGQCDEATRQSDIEDGKMLQTAANIGLATGLTGLGLGATLIVIGGRSPSESTPSSNASGTGAMITYAGRF